MHKKIAEFFIAIVHIAEPGAGTIVDRANGPRPAPVLLCGIVAINKEPLY